jgi:heptosyltransferase III
MNKSILVIIQRSNGDVLLSLPLINTLNQFYHSPRIDLLVNDDTYQTAKLLPNINIIHEFSYKKKKESRYKQEKDLILKIYRKYDLSINLTASDRSVIYALLASNNSISAIEKDIKKSWWKKLFLWRYYNFDVQNHILKNNLQPLNLLNIKHQNSLQAIKVSNYVIDKVKNFLGVNKVKNFIIFHPSAQYLYKVYPENLRHELLSMLNTLGISILVTGGPSEVDTEIKGKLKQFSNVIDAIGETSLEEYIALSELSLGYVGMDTLNMHIAATQNKRIFAIFGPTILSMWSPWSNKVNKSATKNVPIQTYGNVTIFQANMNCVACGNAGCEGNGKSQCLSNINPKIVFEEIRNWYKNVCHLN